MRPVDALILGYIAFVTLVIVARGGLGEPTNWWLLLGHALIAVLVLLFTKLKPEDRVGHVVHHLYPILLIPALYAEIGALSVQLGVENTFARDAIVQGWEAALFGGQVSYTWIREAPSVFWSGLLHLAYLSYYPIVLLPPALLAWRGRWASVRHVVFATIAAFVACYVVFVLFPVAGPNWAFDHPTGPVREVWSARLVYWALGTGSSFGAAFPSSHVAATTATVLAVAREWRTLAWIFALPALLLVVGTVYCQMHYGIDALAGLAVGIGAAGVAGRITVSGER